jgi:hypothetical protein
MVFFFFSEPSRARKIRFWADSWLFSNSLAILVRESLVEGLPGRFLFGLV